MKKTGKFILAIILFSMCSVYLPSAGTAQLNDSADQIRKSSPADIDPGFLISPKWNPDPKMLITPPEHSIDPGMPILP